MPHKKSLPNARASREEPPRSVRPVSDVMTIDPDCCLASTSAQEVAKLMRERGTGIVPVINDEEDRRLVGVVTDRDLCLCLIATGRASSLPIEECMTMNAVTCQPEDPVDLAIELMGQYQVRRIPVVDQENRIQGIVSLADMVRRGEINGRLTQEALEYICEPTPSASKPRAEFERTRN